MAESVRVLLKEEDVDKRIQELGDMISRDYQGKSIHLVCVLKGGVFFMCELAKRITVPVTMDFMSASSYGSSTKSSGVVKIVKDLDEPLKDRDVLIVEDIVDSGYSMKFLTEHIKLNGAKKVYVCTLENGDVKYVLPLKGQGMWGGISCFLALSLTAKEYRKKLARLENESEDDD